MNSEAVKTLVSIRFKTHNVNENDEFIPPALSDTVEVFCIEGEAEGLKQKIKNLFEEHKNGRSASI